MLISVIIPTKSRPAAIVDAVRSVFAGTHQDFELFVIDQSPDGSSHDALQPFMSDRRFHHLFNRRPGFGAASSRNLGIALSSGAIIAIMDDDVEARPDWLERIIAEFSADPQLLFIAGKLTAPPYDPETGFVPWFDANPALTNWQLPILAAGANFSMRRSLFDSVGGFDEFCGPGSRLRASDDTDLCFRIMRSGAKWKACPAIEVIHTHGFRAIEDAQALFTRYQYGNGGNFGRFTRRGDVLAGLWFLTRELRQILRSLLNIGRGRPSGLRYTLTRWQGFWDGFRLSPKEGFVSGAELARRGAELRSTLPDSTAMSLAPVNNR